MSEVPAELEEERGSGGEYLLRVASGTGPSLGGPSVFLLEVHALGASCDGDVVVVGVVPLLLRNSRVTSPNLQLDPVSRVAPCIQAIVGSAQLDLTVSLVDVPELVGAEPGALGVTSTKADEGTIARGSSPQGKTLGIIAVRVN